MPRLATGPRLGDVFELQGAQDAFGSDARDFESESGLRCVVRIERQAGFGVAFLFESESGSEQNFFLGGPRAFRGQHQTQSHTAIKAFVNMAPRIETFFRQIWREFFSEDNQIVAGIEAGTAQSVLRCEILNVHSSGVGLQRSSAAQREGNGKKSIRPILKVRTRSRKIHAQKIQRGKGGT
jgi:hypothetical protein